MFFIGRLVGEKGADLLPEVIDHICTTYKNKVNILILGSGEPEIEHELGSLIKKHKKQYGLFIGYDEALAHRFYSGADFIIMPSRVEPCGLNQLYSLRYGTMPIVNTTGGLQDTIIDFSLPEGYGIRFDNDVAEDVIDGISRAIELYEDNKRLEELQVKMMSLDFSWNKSANQYLKLYKSLTKL